MEVVVSEEFKKLQLQPVTLARAREVHDFPGAQSGLDRSMRLLGEERLGMAALYKVLDDVNGIIYGVGVGGTMWSGPYFDARQKLCEAMRGLKAAWAQHVTDAMERGGYSDLRIEEAWPKGPSDSGKSHVWAIRYRDHEGSPLEEANVYITPDGKGEF
jgi:hypothetical protein